MVCLDPLPAPPPADRILVVRLGALGDVVRTLPAVSALRAAYAGAHVTWLVESAAASAIAGQPCVDEVLVFPRDALGEALSHRRFGAAARRCASFAAALRRQRFDLVLDFHAIARSALLSLLSGSRRRVSYARPFGRELAYLAATDRARLAPGRVSRFARNLALVSYLGIDPRPSPAPLAVEPAARARLGAMLGPGPAPVAIHIGSSDATVDKRYTVEGYSRFARELHEREGLASIATWGPARDDRAAAEALVGAAAGAVRLAPETPSVAELAALLACCRLFVGGDTGPLHVASLVGTPVVQILGPTDPVENAPWPRTPARSVRTPADHISAVPPSAVVAAARELLAESARAAAGGRRT